MLHFAHAQSRPLFRERRNVRPFRSALAGAALALAVLGAAPAMAQSGDMRELINRLNRIENEMQTLSREVYRGGGRAPAASGTGGAIGGGDLPANQAARIEARLTTIENDMQSLYGKYEETSHQLGQLREQLTKLMEDVEFRLQRLEQGQAGARSGAGPAGEARGAAVASSAPAGIAPQTAALPPASTVDSAMGTLPGGTAQEQYDHAFNLIRQGDYANAEKAFARFLRDHGTHALADNAQYWLGETMYVRNLYKEAAVAFAEGYQKFPKGKKAADSLLKLAMSLGQLNQKAEACLALQQLATEHKDAPGTIKRRAEQEKNRLKCG